MALKGSLDDFNIVNILQMIKLEGKTGRLTLSEKDDQVKITFDQGNIIYAEGSPARDEGRIESTILSNHIMNSNDWSVVKKEHEDKLKPYWELLSKRINPQIILELLNRQVVDTVYFALRWKQGNYEFAQMKSIKYNRKVMVPMDVDGLLMEGCRIADEWTRVSGSIPPLDTFVSKNIMGEQEEGEDSLEVEEGQISVENYKSSLEYEILSARGVTLSDSEVKVLSTMGRGKTIRELMDSARQSHFMTLESIQSLLQREVIKPSKKKKTVVAADHTGGSSQSVAIAALCLLFFGGLAWQFISFGNSLNEMKQGALQVKRAQAQDGLNKLERAIKVYKTLTTNFPKNLNEMALAGVVKRSDLIDPWDNQYVLDIKKKKFSLYSNGPDSVLKNDNIYLSN